MSKTYANYKKILGFCNIDCEANVFEKCKDKQNKKKDFTDVNYKKIGQRILDENIKSQ